MNFQRNTAGLATLLLSATLLQGCGGDDDVPVAVTTPPAPPAPTAVACSDMAQVKIPSVPTVISTAERIDASASAPWTSPNSGGGSATVTQPFCRVAGSIKPSTQSDIQFELWLPIGTTWNRKFAGTAAGGSAGYISYPTVNLHLSMGYASVGHNNGHPNAQVDFALIPDRKLDFAYRAQHVATQVGKELTQAYYAAAPTYAYYNGCSQGGHHGIMEMQRYPDDYDGIIAGAPASDWTGTLAAEANAALAQSQVAGAGISRTLLAAVKANALAACDGKAGVDPLRDGVLDDPRLCHWSPSSMQCGAAGVDPSACLAPEQVAALQTAYSGRFKTTGERVAFGYPVEAPGGNFFPNDATSPDRPQGSWSNHWRYAVYEMPGYDFNGFDWNNAVDYARGKEGATYDAISGNYSAFADRGGKFLMYHGWADSLITPALTISEWDTMRAQMGRAKVESFARLYMVPGMDHCGGGNGTSNFELLTALSKWREQGIAPDGSNAGNTTIASRAANATTGVTARTRPLCPYPSVALYGGSGSIDDASNFRCVSN